MKKGAVSTEKNKQKQNRNPKNTIKKIRVMIGEIRHRYWRPFGVQMNFPES